MVFLLYIASHLAWVAVVVLILLAMTVLSITIYLLRRNLALLKELTRQHTIQDEIDHLNDLWQEDGH